MTVRRLRPDDHFMVLAESDATPMQIGALLLLRRPIDMRGPVFETLRDHFLARLAATPLLAVLHQSPDGFDSDVWVDVTRIDVEQHFKRVADRLDEVSLNERVAHDSVRRLDLRRPPFRFVIYEDTSEDTCAVHLAVHHCVTDGIGFQTILGRLSDECPAVPFSSVEVTLPTRAQWLDEAAARFREEEPLRAVKRARLDEARDNLHSGELPPRARTPTLKLSGSTSAKRAYIRMSLSFDRVRSLATALGATINDIFLALASSALRRYLLEIDDLPDTPIVINSARSYRRSEHGEFGNRIVAMHPHLATTIDDPLARLVAIQASMATERARGPGDEAFLDQLETPFGPRDRRAKFANRTDGRALLPGNITLSNVPGPATPRSFAGFQQQSNHPVPILGNGRFLNVTSRRNAASLDLGIMADPTKISDVTRFARFLNEALREYEGLAP